jgi:hypothetical protein
LISDRTILCTAHSRKHLAAIDVTQHTGVDSVWFLNVYVKNLVKTRSKFPSDTNSQNTSSREQQREFSVHVSVARRERISSLQTLMHKKAFPKYVASAVFADYYEGAPKSAIQAAVPVGVS